MPDFEMGKKIPAKAEILATAQWAEHGVAQTGTRLIRIGFDLDETAPNGRNQDTVDLYLTTDALKISRAALKTLGIDFETVPAHDFDTDNGLTKLIGGKRCRLTYIEEEKDNGSRRWRATWINRVMQKPKSGSALEMLRSVKSEKKNGKSDTPLLDGKEQAPLHTTTPEAAEQYDDDMPF